MARAASIHIGVNRPAGRFCDRPLQHSETSAWRMAGLASQAGYESILVLRGGAATRPAVHGALTGAAGTLAPGDTLLVTFSGHGSQEHDEDCDEGHGWDEAWCLADGVLVDDKLAGYWRLFEPGVRIVVVVESCYSAGTGRDDDEGAARISSAARAPGVPVMRDGGGWRGGRGGRPAAGASPAAADYAGPCIAEAPFDSHGIHATLLLLAASTEDQPSSDGLFSRVLLETWDGGAFQGSYCDLHRAVRARVMRERPTQEPQILMLGAGDPAFAMEPAFHLRARDPAPTVVYR